MTRPTAAPSLGEVWWWPRPEQKQGNLKSARHLRRALEWYIWGWANSIPNSCCTWGYSQYSRWTPTAYPNPGSPATVGATHTQSDSLISTCAIHNVHVLTLLWGVKRASFRRTVEIRIRPLPRLIDQRPVGIGEILHLQEGRP